jgi:fatty-acyl-CoA synthase
MTTSHVSGARSPPLLEYTIGHALDLAAQAWPDSDALVSAHQGVRLSWSELRARVDEFAAGLLALGLRKGDRVGIWAPNCVEWTIVQFATARVGLIQVNINPAYKSSELKYTLNKVGVAALICATRVKGTQCASIVEEVAPELFNGRSTARGSGVPTLRHVILIGTEPRVGWLPFEQVRAIAGPADRADVIAIADTLDRYDAINIQFTSGTTGLPKGATLSHRNVLNNAYSVGLGMGLCPGDRLCIPVPLYHCFGMVMGNLACLVHGAAMVYPSETFDPLAVLRTVAAERCTALHGVPTMFIAELEQPAFDEFDLSSLRTGIMAGAPCPIEVMRKVVDRMHMSEIGIAYGMTETSPVSFQSTVDDPLERRVTSIGKVQSHLEVKVIGAGGETVSRNTSGELCTKGYSVMLGYWDDVEKTREVLDAEGWMHTGDLAMIDDEGYGHIIGRLKDMVIRGGENIYPREVEEFLYSHPKVEAVEVVGVPDLKYGEELCAWIKLRAGDTATYEEIAAYCKGRVAHYKVPKYIRFVHAFPTTVTGKVQKHAIRRAMIEELQLQEPRTA